MSKIKTLLSTYQGSRIYVYLADATVGERFLQDAENEGFLFSDEAKPTDKHVSDIIAVNDDMTLNYVGFVGHMAYGTAEEVSGKPLVRIDYRNVDDRIRRIKN